MVKTEDYKPLPAPQTGDTFNTTVTRLTRVAGSGSKRQPKGLKQFAVKVRPRTKARFKAIYEAAAKTKPDLTRGDFLELIIAAWEAQATGRDLNTAIESLRREAVPPPEDRAEGRDVPLTVFATPPLAKALIGRAKEKDWTLSATIEQACHIAKEYSHMYESATETPPAPNGKARGKTKQSKASAKKQTNRGASAP